MGQSFSYSLFFGGLKILIYLNKQIAGKKLFQRCAMGYALVFKVSAFF